MYIVQHNNSIIIFGQARSERGVPQRDARSPLNHCSHELVCGADHYLAAHLIIIWATSAQRTNESWNCLHNPSRQVSQLSGDDYLVIWQLGN